MPARTFCTKHCHPLLRGVCRTRISTDANVARCRESVVVSRTSRSERQRACFLVWRLSTMSCRRLPVFVFDAAVRITCRTSANSGVSLAKLLLVPFCLILHAVFRLRTSTHSLAPLMMSFLRHEISEDRSPDDAQSLVAFPNTDKSIGTFSEAATCLSVLSTGFEGHRPGHAAKPFRMCEFKWQWFCAGGGAGASIASPILKSSSNVLPSLSSSSPLSHTSVSPSAPSVTSVPSCPVRPSRASAHTSRHARPSARTDQLDRLSDRLTVVC